jgi:hypothetical protein
MSFAAEVIADASGKWFSNAVRFATEAEAQAWAHDRMMRWTAVRDTRVVETEDPVNYRWLDNRLVALSAEEEAALKAAAPAFAALLREQGIIK